MNLRIVVDLLYSRTKISECTHFACVQGMVEAGDTVSATLKKEFGEEAMNSLEGTKEEKEEIEARINTLFQNGEEVRTCKHALCKLCTRVSVKQIYAGYVDDPRNTDNAWMETVAQNFHDEDGTKHSNVILFLHGRV